MCMQIRFHAHATRSAHADADAQRIMSQGKARSQKDFKLGMTHINVDQIALALQKETKLCIVKLKNKRDCVTSLTSQREADG